MTLKRPKKIVNGMKWAGARKGIQCPDCGSRASHVYRTINGEQRITRARECIHCGKKWQTIEMTK